MTGIELKYVEVKNFRQYAGVQRFELASSSSRNINIVEGQNGAGKSNFLNALTLCLYKDEYHRSADSESESLPLVSQQILQDLEKGETASGYIEVCFGKTHREYIFRREFSTTKNDEGEYYDSLENKTLQQQQGSNWSLVENPNTILNQIIPGDIHEYFIFDGEDLDELFKRNYQEKIKKGVIDVSQIDLLDNALYHIGEMKDDYESEAAELGGSTQKKLAEKREKSEKIDEKEDLVEDLENEITEKRKEIDEIDNKLEDARNERVIELRAERSNLEDQLTTLETDLESEREKAGETILSAGPPILSFEAVKEAYENLNNASPNKELPPGVTNQLIDRLIESGECICGVNLSQSSDHRKHLEHLQDELEGISDELLEGQSTLPRILDSAIERADRVQDLRSNIRELEDEISQIQLRLQDISNELKTYDLPDNVDIDALESQRTQLNNEIEEITRRIGSLENDLDDLRSKKKKIDEELNAERKKDQRLQRVNQKIDFVIDVNNDLSSIRRRIINNIRNEVEQKMNKYFNELVWKEDEFNLQLNDDYSIEIYQETSTENLLGSLSAGERQVLALSFMAAIAQISGFEAPTVIDTPLGRISSEPRQRIAQNLPNYLEDTQITFLMTDEEYRDEVEKSLDQYVANEYHLDYHDGVTEVKTRG